MTKLLTNPTVRLIGRALFVGLFSVITQLNASGPTIAWRTVAVTAGYAAINVLTPLNSQLGLFKTQ